MNWIHNSKYFIQKYPKYKIIVDTCNKEYMQCKPICIYSDCFAGTLN